MSKVVAIHNNIKLGVEASPPTIVPATSKKIHSFELLFSMDKYKEISKGDTKAAVSHTLAAYLNAVFTTC
ncbi:hypothetical protein GCM10023149_18480 [Mucilaginibacter gynuensis]|uniref:Uncharacterized protein n=1 Tax=Mucilaginibacter gynuensis TaxID=1302236 RepID=A0ABP8G9B4_9SPHI